MGQRAGALVRACIAAACVAAAAAGVPVRASTDAALRREGDLLNLPTIEAEQGGPPTTSVIEISETETRTELWHPMCFNKKIALLGTFCVAPTTPEDDKDPNHLLPRLTFEVTREPNTPPLTVFLFDDEESSWPLFWRMVVQNKTCDELSDNKSSTHAKAAIFEDPSAAPTPYGAKIHSFKNIRGRFYHYWHLVAVDCEKRECPEVQSANITFFHPNSNGKNDVCSDAGVGQSVKALSDSMMQAVQAANMRNVLSVLGLTHFGVFVLYVVFITMLLFSVLFLIWAVRSESNRRFLYLNTLFMTSITAMAYLTMATGHGICVLRKVDGSWHFSNPLFANPGSKERPNPMYNSAYGEAATYPIFYARHMSQFITSPLLLMDLFLVSGVSNNTRFFILFANAISVLCWLIGSLITTASRWAFWVFGTIFAVGVLLPLIGVLPTSAAHKGRASRRLYGRLMCICIITGMISPWAWVLIDGAHAIPIDVAVCVYAVLDVLSQCIFGVVLLRKAPPVLSDWGEENMQQAARLNPGGSTPGPSMGDPNDDL